MVDLQLREVLQRNAHFVDCLRDDIEDRDVCGSELAECEEVFALEMFVEAACPPRPRAIEELITDESDN